MVKIIITFEITEPGTYSIVSDEVSWEGLCKSATLYYDNEKTKICSKTMKLAPGLNTVELVLKDEEILCPQLFENTKISTCIIEEGAKEIGQQCFSGCFRLRSLTLPSTLTTIDYGAFMRCDALEVLSIPHSVTEAYGAFIDFDLDKVQFAPGIEALPIGAFARCKNPEYDLRIPEGIVKLEYRDEDFSDFDESEFRSIIFPSTLKEIEQNALYGVTLGHFEWPENIPFQDQQIRITGGISYGLCFLPIPASASSLPESSILTPRLDNIFAWSKIKSLLKEHRNED